MVTAQQDLAARVGDHLTQAWRLAFEATPRELFIPHHALWLKAGAGKVRIDRDIDPDTWTRAVYSDDVIITQFDDGIINGEGEYTSSASMPSIMLTMLNELDVHHGHQVLEIGTGTGYNAALLAARLGDHAVTTIEIDAHLAEQARRNLAKLGRNVFVSTGDGAAGYLPRAPYDRVIATCSVETIPWPWVAQTRPGGVIVTPWGPAMANDHLLRLEVDDDRAVGTIVGSVGFMRLRDQRWMISDEPDDFPDIATASGTDLDTHEVLGNHSTLAVALHLGPCRAIFEPDLTTGTEILWLLAADSWASVSQGQVHQAGARNLWDEAVTAYHWWIKHNRPNRQQFHLTVTSERQWVWLDHPANLVTTLTPPTHAAAHSSASADHSPVTTN